VLTVLLSQNEVCNAGICEPIGTLTPDGGACSGDDADGECESVYCFEQTCRAVSDITSRAAPAHCVSNDNCQQVSHAVIFLTRFMDSR